MDDVAQDRERIARFNDLTRSDASSKMGKLLRRFWQPVGLSDSVKPGEAKSICIMGEDLTLYRGESGRPYLVDAYCAHRRTRMHTGWIEGEEIRCVFHGWKYDGTGRCIERPAEGDKTPKSIRFAGYPARDYGGLVFAYMGEGEAPPFVLPRKPTLEDPDWLVVAGQQIWDFNWFQALENVVDAVHVSFVHQKGHVGQFGSNVTTGIPQLEYLETEAGIRQIATRGENNVRISDWTFPNNNHVLSPGPTKDDPWMHITNWLVPINDQKFIRFSVFSAASTTPEADLALKEQISAGIAFNPADHYDELFNEGKFPEEEIALVAAQDYLALAGQGTVVDRSKEILGRSDMGIVFLRRLFFREMDAVAAGKGIKEWQPLKESAVKLKAAAG